MKYVIPGLEAIMGQPGIMAPRGGFRVPFGDSDSSRIVHSIRQANVRPQKVVSSANNLRQALSTARRTRSITRYPRFVNPTKSGSSFRSVPLSSPSITRKVYPLPKSIVGPSPYQSILGRVTNLVRSGGSMAARMAARVTVAMGPIGIAIALAAAAAVAIGAVVYYVHKHNSTQLIPDAIDSAIDKEYPVKNPTVDKIVPDVPWKEIAVQDDLWAGNVPWRRRPGRDLTLFEVLNLQPALRSMIAAA